jgi:hypothetical protein
VRILRVVFVVLISGQSLVYPYTVGKSYGDPDHKMRYLGGSPTAESSWKVFSGSFAYWMNADKLLLPDDPPLDKRWVRLGAGSDGDAHFIDSKTIEPNGSSSISFWWKKIHVDGSYMDMSSDMECGARRLKVTSLRIYSNDDKLVNTSDSTGDWVKIGPDTVAEFFYDFLCNKRQ